MKESAPPKVGILNAQRQVTCGTGEGKKKGKKKRKQPMEDLSHWAIGGIRLNAFVIDDVEGKKKEKKSRQVLRSATQVV